MDHCKYIFRDSYSGSLHIAEGVGSGYEFTTTTTTVVGGELYNFWGQSGEKEQLGYWNYLI